MAEDAERRLLHAPNIAGLAYLGTLVRRTRLVLVWERIWPRLAPLLGVVGTFLTVSWFGVFDMLPFAARIGLLGLFGVGLVLALLPLLRLPLPSTADSLG